MIAAYLKFGLVTVLCLLGAYFLLLHVGLGIPVVRYREFEAQSLPAGAILLVAGVAIAHFWRIQITVKKTVTESDGRGGFKTTEAEENSQMAQRVGKKKDKGPGRHF